jgi:hypothetical protein
MSFKLKWPRNRSVAEIPGVYERRDRALELADLRRAKGIQKLN